MATEDVINCYSAEKASVDGWAELEINDARRLDE